MLTIQISFAEKLAELQKHIQQQLQLTLSQIPSYSATLSQAMQYAVLNGGKRVRPVLVYLTGEMLGAKAEYLHAPATAIELIHCYSLVHDDLPAMDNDDFRRGRPTCHKSFNEATAILVGDALQSAAFSCLGEQKKMPPAMTVAMVQTLAQAAGAAGMAAGQALDLEAEGKSLTVAQIEQLQHLKTGALLRASVRLGALAAGCENPAIFSALDQFALKVGLAFQIQDDLLNIEGDKHTLGKNIGTDAAKHKATYPSATSVSAAKLRVQTLIEEGMQALNSLSRDTKLLQDFCTFLSCRSA